MRTVYGYHHYRSTKSAVRKFVNLSFDLLFGRANIQQIKLTGYPIGGFKHVIGA
jgi:uncharacterized protein YjlB